MFTDEQTMGDPCSSSYPANYPHFTSQQIVGVPVSIDCLIGSDAIGQEDRLPLLPGGQEQNVQQVMAFAGGVQLMVGQPSSTFWDPPQVLN
jgi:hypothetical protein